MALSIEVAANSDVGCVRTNNEDFAAYDTDLGVYLVLDGMGGQAAGEVASRMGAETVLNYFRESRNNGGGPPWPAVGNQVENASAAANALASAIHVANEAIYTAASEHAARRGMGSTIVSVLFDAERGLFSIAHVGDSRIYLFRQGELRQLTNDHSLVMEQVRRGLITREEAEKSDMQNIIIRALGPEGSVEPDVDDQIAQSGDILMLATDGLTKLVPDDRIQQVLASPRPLSRMIEELTQAAKDQGGDDNITCMLLRIQQRPWYKQWLHWLLPSGGSQWQSSS
jgi:PPM family protein phosphatase